MTQDMEPLAFATNSYPGLVEGSPKHCITGRMVGQNGEWGKTTKKHIRRVD